MFDSWDSSPSSSTSALTNNILDDPLSLSDTTSSPLDVDAVSPVIDEPRTLLSISTAFYPGSTETQGSDLVLASVDGTYFFIHRSRLLAGSSNSFGGYLPPLAESKKVEEAMISILSASPLAEDTSIDDPTIDLHSISAVEDLEVPSIVSDRADTSPEVVVTHLQSAVLNIILHVIYGLPMEQFRPDLQLLCVALSELTNLGYQPSELVTPHSEIFHLLVAQSRTYPLVVYALAAGHKIERLAVSCSTNTLAVELSEITDDLAAIMGPVYLRRLFFLHIGRTDALKRLLLEPPVGHPPSLTCSIDNQKSLTRAWALAVAYMAVEGRPNTHPTMLSSSLSTLGEHLECPSCQASLADRVRSVVQQWAAVSSTI